MENKIGIQEKVKKFCDKNGLESRPIYLLLDLVSEVGELAKEILKTTSYGSKDINMKTSEIREEMGDIFFSLINLSNCFDLDLEKSLDHVLSKYKKRIKDHGDPGSNKKC